MPTQPAVTHAFVEPGPDRYYSIAGTPVGEFLLVSDGEAIVEVELPSFAPWTNLPASYVRDDAVLAHVTEELAAYFAGDLTTFSSPLAPLGTSFRRAVWGALLDISYGTTASYGEIADIIGHPKAARAVGMANHVNPIALVIPCHRVIGANGSLTGYGGGLTLKNVLLEHESRVVKGHQTQWYTEPLQCTVDDDVVAG